MVPALTTCAFQILLLPLLAGNAPLDRPLPVDGTDDLFQYDDGTAHWLSWDGLYRGVWFHAQDFGQGDVFVVSQLEFWFFHHSSFPWDIASFYAELWAGDQSGPATQMDQVSITAEHYSPTYADYGYLEPDGDAWGLVNTEMSAGGWPSLLGDNTPNPVNHSFFSSDSFRAWEPWIMQGPTANDYFIRIVGSIHDLDQSTWGAIKTLF
jgi:hypothetical protein